MLNARIDGAREVLLIGRRPVELLANAQLQILRKLRRGPEPSSPIHARVRKIGKPVLSA